jgi:hypothetical protein
MVWTYNKKRCRVCQKHYGMKRSKEVWGGMKQGLDGMDT